MINRESTPQFGGVFKQEDEKCSYHSPSNWVIFLRAGTKVI